ncbi:hypothetical protein BGW36DRAFT_399182 [Talaromyces proteolyticus]|uniref:DUF6603 domain-containing protein n=1 Tax=Talaromyces proteolyticus TaxID=1131652 RepID=A0AAD4KPW0_9EURO|nr:uncharacterized protein BGW36DRAFT_399182 [Talaromyces proteolyticus]KAH8693993.1 hypothetical protein BGW36DRAFT_399182 [Talaromyces proteolyticus]
MIQRTAPSVATNKWKVELTLSNVYGSTLYEFFEENSKDGVASMLDHIEIEKLTFIYTYEGANTSKFETDGTIKLGALPLDLKFTHTADEWTFEADLAFGESDPPKTTIGKIAGHIFGPDIDNELPFFVADISIQPPKKKNSVGIKMHALKEQKPEPESNDKPAAEPPKSDTKKDIFFSAWVEFAGFSFQAFQYKAAPTVAIPKPVTQRAFRITVAAIPKVTIDLIGELPQPFDEMVFLYVQKQNGDKEPSGLTYDDVEKMNTQLDKDQQLKYKVTKKDYQPTDVVIPAGFHFMLLRNDPQKGRIVALDYLFGKGKSKPKPKPKFYLSDASPTGPAAETEETEPDPGSAKAPYEKKVGPITISNMGLQYSLGDKPSLSVLMDASIVLGPIGVGLLGFKITLIFQKNGSEPSKSSTIFHNLPKPDFAIEGLAASFDRPPVILSGIEQDTYQGAATLSFNPYLFQAAGFYDPFTSAFVYFVLNGPLATLGFAEIRGVVGGFGYNNSLQFPTVTNSAKPDEALKSLMDGTWFFPKKQSFWLAAGLTVLAFELLDVQAVVIKIGIFGVEKKFAHVQLGLTAVDGQLTPASYVLDPSCHLTGGFATSAGDFTPPQYPNPPRLAISWSYDTYFAITPKVCMGGGRLDASLTLGALYAYFDAYADFLIKYKPFFFMADGGVSVGVRFTLDLWICTVHINIELSATLYIQGPPISGRVHVNFWTDHNNDPLTDLPKESAEKPPPFIFSCNRGLIPTSETDAKTNPNDSEWNVRGANFQFTIGCKFAVGQATVVTGQVDPNEKGPEHQFPKESKDLRNIYAKPMHLKGTNTLTSNLTVTIRPTGNSNALTASDEDAGVPEWAKAELMYKSVPVALWGEYDETADPNSSSVNDPNQIDSLLDNKDHSVNQIMGICISSPLPELSNKDLIKPFEYKKFFISTAGKQSYPFPRVQTIEKLWDPEPEDTTTEAWETLRNQWNGQPKFGIGAAEKFVDLWWDTKPKEKDELKDAPITGKAPTNLVGDQAKSEFAKLFLEVPRMGTVAA